MQEKDDRLHGKIKDSFDRMDRKAPLFMWESVSSSLDAVEHDSAEGSPESDPLYQRVRSSFAAGHGRRAPAHVWQTINRQLNIDLVWTRIDRDLDGHGSDVRSWRRWAAAASLLLLLSFAAAFYYLQKAPAYLSARKTPVTVRSESGGASSAPSTQQAKEGKEEALLSKKRAVQNYTSLPYEAGQIDDAVTNERRLLSVSKQRGLASVKGLPSSAGVEELHSETAAAKTSSSSIPFLPLGPHLAHVHEKLNTRGVIAVSSNLQGLMMEPRVVELRSPALRPAAEKENKGKPKVGRRAEFGISLAYNNSRLLNNETKSSLEKGSLISTSPTFRRAIGLTFNYQISGGGSFSTELHLAGSGQEYSMFDGGSYLHKELDLTYYKLYVQYQHNFLRHRESIFSDLTAKVGLYGGLLHQRKGELRAIESRYSKSDYGVRLAMGQERRIGPAMLGYGMSVERGLENIFLGSGSVPSRFNRTYTLSIGPYLNLRL